MLCNMADKGHTNRRTAQKNVLDHRKQKTYRFQAGSTSEEIGAKMAEIERLACTGKTYSNLREIRRT